MATQIQIKRGSTTPAGLTVGESAMNTSTNQIYLGGTGGTVLVGGEVTGGVDMGAGSAVSANRIPTQSGVYNYVRNSTVTSFNGLTGAVGGVCAAQANTFTALQSFSAGISADGITVGGLITNISNDSGSAFNPIIDLYRNSASPASLDAIGQILFNGKDSAGNKQQYVNIHSAILDPSTTVESGQFHIETSTSGAMTEKMRIGAGGLIINNPQGNFHTTIYGQGDTAMFVAQGSTDRIGIGTSTPSVKLDVVGSIKASGGLSAGAGSFTGTLTGVTANFSGLVSASQGISAAGGVTLAGTLQGTTANFTGLVSSAGGFSGAGTNLTNVAKLNTSNTFTSGSYLTVTGVGMFAGRVQVTGNSIIFTEGYDDGSTTLLGQPYTGLANTVTLPPTTGTVALTNGTVASFNGTTGAVQGVSAAVGSTYLTVSGSTGSVTFTNTGVQTFNGLTGAVTGVTVGGANTFTALNTFNAGISAAGGVTFAGTLQGTTAAFSRLVSFTAGLSGTGITLSGNLSAATKSFVIPHPTKPHMTLQHGSLEGPENGVYVRGRLTGTDTIPLPEYWHGLVDSSTITASLTEIGNRNHHWISAVEGYTVTVSSESGAIDCFYTVWGERKDVGKMPVEY